MASFAGFLDLKDTIFRLADRRDLSDSDSYRRYLEVCRDVSHCFLVERGGVPCGDVGRDGGGVDFAQLAYESGLTCVSRGEVQGLCGRECGETKSCCDSPLDGDVAAGEAGRDDAEPDGPVSGEIGGSERDDCSGVVGGGADDDRPRCVECPSGVVRGKNYAKNRRRRGKARSRGTSGCPTATVKDELRASLEEKWKAENALAVLKAKRQAALIGSRDLEQEKKADRTRLQKRVERDMVAIEKTHASLKATGNVPGVPPVGYAETIVDSVPGLSSGGCSISPSSSVSEAEVHRMRKELEDYKVALRDKEVLLAKVAQRCGIEPEFIDEYDKRTWTDTHENGVILDAMYPDGFVKEFDDAPRGKFRLDVRSI